MYNIINKDSNVEKMRTRHNEIGKRRNTTASIKLLKSKRGKENESNKKRNTSNIVHLEPIDKKLKVIDEDLVFSSDDEESIQPDKFEYNEGNEGKQHLSDFNMVSTNNLPADFVAESDNVKVEDDDKQSMNKNEQSIVSKDKARALGSNTISMLHLYVRDILFRQRKIIDIKGSDLDTNGLIMETLLKHLNYSIQKSVNNTAFLNECKCEIMKTINARRNYVKRQLAIMMTELMKDDKLFDLKLMNKFYNKDYEQDNEVLEAWYCYCFKFLPSVSKQWRDAVCTDKLQYKTNMYKCITISDDALVRWLMELWMPHLLQRKNNQWSKPVVQSQVRGPHESLEKRDDFVTWYELIKESRQDPILAFKWNDLFWNEVERKHADKFNRKSFRLNKTISNGLATALKPLPEGLDNLNDPLLMERPTQAISSSSPIKADECLSYSQVVGI